MKYMTQRNATKLVYAIGLTIVGLVLIYLVTQ
jgi:hypothetical protein